MEEFAGSIYLIAAPSGAGKSSLVKALLDKDSRLSLSISHTTRAPRPGEQNGREYHFVSPEQFMAMQNAGEFLESAEVYGNFYGTSSKWIREQLINGHDVVLEIDWQGAQQIRKLFPACVDIFILPPSLASLEQRLKGRGTDSSEIIARRLAAAREDLSHAGEFDYVIINDEFSDAVDDLAAVVRSGRCRRQQQFLRRPQILSTQDL